MITKELEISLFTETYHCDIAIDPEQKKYIWEKEDIISFDDLIISWNAIRPSYGSFDIQVSVKIDEKWTPWMLYANWGSEGQNGSKDLAIGFPVKIDQDQLKISGGKKGDGFRIRIEAVEGALLEEFYALHACASSLGELSRGKDMPENAFIDLKIPLISQMVLQHSRHRDMCSAASTAAVVSFLMGVDRIDPVFFALHAYDNNFDIFGNWTLNVAQASSILGKNWRCWAGRLSGFTAIQHLLRAKIPVVVSVRGPLTGSALPYSSGHLIAVKGYDPVNRRVLCMDPAFTGNENTDVSYHLEDFLEAWSRRGYIAYLFEKKDQNFSDIQSKSSLSSQK